MLIQVTAGRSARDVVTGEIDRRLAKIAGDIDGGLPPAVEDVNAVANLTKLKDTLPVPDRRRVQRVTGIAVTVLVIGALVTTAYVTRSSTAVELDVRASRVEVELGPARAHVLIPGELGELLTLSRAVVAGAEEIDPPTVGDGGEVTLAAPPTTGGGADLAVRLQELALPATGQLSLVIGVAYGPGRRGLLLAPRGDHRATARFGEVVAVPGVQQHAIRPIRAGGKALKVELYPVATDKAEKPLTALRNVKVSKLKFDVDGRGGGSSILGGTIYVQDGPTASVAAQPGDRLEISSSQSLTIRELTFANGELKATVSSPKTTSLRLGTDSPRDLMPTVFDWLRSRWPTQLYATLTALVALWFALRKWWEAPE